MTIGKQGGVERPYSRPKDESSTPKTGFSSNPGRNGNQFGKGADVERNPRKPH